MHQQATVTDPTLFAVLHGVRRDAKAHGYPLAVLERGCKAALRELDSDRTPAVSVAIAARVMARMSAQMSAQMSTPPGAA